MRVAIVNDLRIAVEALRRVVTSDPEHQIAWIANDGQEAIRKCISDKPDVILMDLIMPGMDGAQTTKEIMAKCPCPILVVTATVSGNYSLVYDALGFGAVDAVNTPTIGTAGTVQGGADLLKKLAKMKGTVNESRSLQREPRTTDIPTSKPATLTSPVLLGASTGGPQALLAVLSPLLTLSNVSIWIAQHIGADFFAGFADYLANRTHASIHIAKAGDSFIRPGIHLLPSEPALIVSSQGTTQPDPTPNNSLHTPNINRFFSSVAKNSAKPGIAALLTGMGSDGAQGLLELRQKGWYTLAQDEATSVVYGMPLAAKQLGAAHQILPLDSIGNTISSFIRSSRS